MELDTVPHSSGVYRFLNKEGTVIYVGKAKDLKKRVSQYFQSTRNHSVKTLRMVRQIVSIEYTVVATESDALLLENNLIKTLQPKYNILLKDDKTYPWICVKNEAFPRVMVTHNRLKDGARYFGPYTNGFVCKQLLLLFHTLYPLRTCTLSLTPTAIAAGKYKKCLQAHLGKCLCPCIGGQSEEAYNVYIQSVVSILKGDFNQVKDVLEDQMKQAAARCDFELAQKYKEQVQALSNQQSKSVIVNPQISNLDVFSVVVDADGSMAYGNYLRLAKGAVIQSQNMQFKLRIEETPAAVLSIFMAEVMRQREGLSPEVVVPFLPEVVPEGCRVHVPARGDKKELVDLSLRNAKNFRMEQLRLAEKANPQQRSQDRKEQLLRQMQIDLNTRELPVHIECFDNSNLQGSFPVASCVVFRNGEPSKKDYRHFHIKTVTGANDFASMEEVITRRYTRLEAGLPQLIVVDGGKGQLSSAYKALHDLGLDTQVTLIGLAKRLEEIYRAGDSTPLFLDKNASTLRVLMRLRDEAHRFGITFHRQQRSSGFAQSSLLAIKGVGPVTVEKLLKQFGSVKRLKEASEEQIAACVGKKAASLVMQALMEQDHTRDLPTDCT